MKNWMSASLRRKDHFFVFHLILRGKLDVCGRDVLSRSENYNFRLFIENVTLVCLDYYVYYHFLNLDYFRYFLLRFLIVLSWNIWDHCFFTSR